MNISKLKNQVAQILTKRANLVIIIGLIGIALIFSSTFLESENSAENEKTSASITAEEYGLELERKLSEQISEVIGGDVKVMVTLQTGIEFVYASEAKNNESEIENADSTVRQKLQKDKQSENNYIIYQDENGNEVPLVITEIMPEVKGVVVGCYNGDNEAISAIVKNLVKTALNISDDKVCVVGLDLSR